MAEIPVPKTKLSNEESAPTHKKPEASIRFGGEMLEYIRGEMARRGYTGAGFFGRAVALYRWVQTERDNNRRIVSEDKNGLNRRELLREF